MDESPLISGARKVYGTVTKYLGDSSRTDDSKTDTSWHDKMVREANDSFRKGTTLKGSPSSGSKPKTKKTRKGTTLKR